MTCFVKNFDTKTVKFVLKQNLLLSSRENLKIEYFDSEAKRSHVILRDWYTKAWQALPLKYKNENNSLIFYLAPDGKSIRAIDIKNKTYAFINGEWIKIEYME